MNLKKHNVYTTSAVPFYILCDVALTYSLFLICCFKFVSVEMSGSQMTMVMFEKEKR